MALDESDTTRTHTTRTHKRPQPSKQRPPNPLPRAPWRSSRGRKPIPPQRRHPRRVLRIQTTHWGEYIQGLIVHDGKPLHALVTVPDASLYTRVTAIPQRRGSGVVCFPRSKAKAVTAAQLLLEKWAPGVGVALWLDSNIPEGVGGGSSSADCTGVAFAILDMLGVETTIATNLELLREVIFRAEGPCDPLALLSWGITVLWGSRTGNLVKAYNTPLPPMYAVGFVTDPTRTVSTDALAQAQAKADEREIARDIDAFAPVLAAFESSLAAGSARGVAEAAMYSGSLNQRRCPIKHWDRLTRLTPHLGALGLSCSHSGTAAAFLFDPSDDDLDERIACATSELRALGAAHIHEFRTDSEPTFWRNQR